jgi:hypothetical protein
MSQTNWIVFLLVWILIELAIVSVRAKLALDRIEPEVKAALGRIEAKLDAISKRQVE